MTQPTESGPRPIQPLQTLAISAASDTTPPPPGYLNDIYVSPVAAGVRVTQQTALTFAAVYAAIRAISEDIAGLGHTTRAKNENGTRQELDSHPATRVIAYPNGEMTGYSLREAMQAHALSWGNGYAEIERNARRRPVALWLITPDRVTPRRIDGDIWYQVRNVAGNDDTYLPASDMLHLHGLGYDGLGGYSVIHMAARTIGMGIAGDEYGAATYNNRATPSGVLKHAKTLDKDGRENLRESWENLYKGSKNASRVAILEEGLEFEALGLPPEDIQFLQNRQFQIEEIARWYRIPPHKLAHIVKATFNNIEEQNINYVQDSLLPWVNRWESESDVKLLAPGERGSVKVKFNLNTLLRGSVEKRTESYVKGRQWGWLSPNDVRTFEDMDPLPADIGDSYITPLNMTPTELLGQEPEPPPPPPETDEDTDEEPGEDEGPPPENTPAAHFRPVMVDALRRCIDREIKHAARAPKSIESAQEFVGWSAKFYARHNEYCTSAIRPVCESITIQALGYNPNAPTATIQVFVERFTAATRDLVKDAWVAGTLQKIDVDAQAGGFAEILAGNLADLFSIASTDNGAAS